MYFSSFFLHQLTKCQIRLLNLMVILGKCIVTTLCNMRRLDILDFEINQDDFGFIHIRNRENNKQFGQRKVLWNKPFEEKGGIRCGGRKKRFFERNILGKRENIRSGGKLTTCRDSLQTFPLNCCRAIQPPFKIYLLIALLPFPTVSTFSPFIFYP